MQDEREVPRLVVAIGGEDAAGAESVPALAEAVLLDAGAAPPERVAALAAGLRGRLPAGAALLVAGSPAAAGEAGAGAVLPEFGVDSDEARRLLGGGLLGREVSSAAAGALARGVDFLVADAAALGPAGVRSLVEQAWVPVLCRAATPDIARAALAAGAEGLVVPWSDAAAVGAFAALLPAREGPDPWLVNGASVPWEPHTAVADLLADLGLPADTRVEVNGIPVPRRQHDDRLLAPGDRIATG